MTTPTTTPTTTPGPSAVLNDQLGKIADDVERIWGTNNGKTALFWALVVTINTHIQ